MHVLSLGLIFCLFVCCACAFSLAPLIILYFIFHSLTHFKLLQTHESIIIYSLNLSFSRSRSSRPVSSRLHILAFFSSSRLIGCKSTVGLLSLDKCFFLFLFIIVSCEIKMFTNIHTHTHTYYNVKRAVIYFKYKNKFMFASSKRTRERHLFFVIIIISK